MFGVWEAEFRVTGLCVAGSLDVGGPWLRPWPSPPTPSLGGLPQCPDWTLCAPPGRAGDPTDTGTCSLAGPQEARDDAKVTCLARAGHSDPQRLARRYHWKCTPASSPGRPCFTGPSPRSLHVGAPTLSFAADSLSRSYDQFLVTLVVSSEGRNSSEAQVFLSTRLDSALRYCLS